MILSSSCLRWVILQLRGWGGTPWEEGSGRWMESKFCSLREAPTLHRRNAFLRGKGCKGHPVSLLSPNFATGRGHAACRRRGQGLWETKQELGSILGQSPGWPDLRSSLNPGPMRLQLKERNRCSRKNRRWDKEEIEREQGWMEWQNEGNDWTRKEVESNPGILSAQTSALAEGLALCNLPS